MADPVDPTGWTCPLPLRDHHQVVLGHGGGGVLSSELIEHLFLPAFGTTDTARAPADSAVLDVAGARLAFSTDSYVVRPLFFPGGSIGELAVHGTINDLACAGAVPVALSAGFILEEGLELAVLGRVAQAMGRAAAAAGVRLATGDTKVVERGLADGLYVNTSGIGLVPAEVDIRPERARPGDRVIVSGPVGEHGVAVLSVRDGLEFGGEVRSDTTALHGLVAAVLAAAPGVHALRDPTRGGLATALCEIAAASGTGIEFAERAVPVPPAVEAACGFLGLDPLHVANEGKLVAFVADADADAALAAMRAHPAGRDAAVIGTVTAEHPGVVVGRTAFGGTRIVDRPLGEQLPRIC
ncbi:hydrogenase maturation factor [Frankia casuarinae]|uniref:Hydrogenase expression/formation protein HypE n=2 Tax=Frankia casuarinae (strain DSM 45818 / CECT 9043 / HFP020203 / CcI3) TaxID=106370 RepID=Q2JE41_FRACC|nr:MULTISPECIES: hydrogenase expression/formation protein HypE [Frankia]ABD10451.1 Hydrogenase expression/formation protein HypE [Frankia casuarinae]ETA00880.1 hydrogenase maturation factor [Frankia sp. CcI6]EYT91332.1 hydrogenase maturation factor [Frankia casuarinae]OAA21537.1 Hydrogenase maturation protein, carbamoyl dehydratase HypE [Frankia casuarinae]OHV51989.1 hydrogenase expression/formation protein HypE [Frankia sp. CgIS1]